MPALLFYFLPVLILLGMVTTFDDIRRGVIRNKWIALAALFAVAGNLSLFLSGNGIVDGDYLALLGINCAFALFAGIFLWIGSLWSAGDAKLFLAFSMLLPLTIYETNALPYFPSIALMINTFVPFFIFYAFLVLRKSSLKIKKQTAAMMLKPSFIAKNVFLVFVFSYISSKVALFLGIFAPVLKNLFVLITFLFFINYALERWLPVSLLYPGAAVSALALLIDSRMILSLPFAYNFGLLLFFFVFIRYFVLHLAYEVFSYPIFIENLKPGMLIAENFLSRDDDTFQRKPMLPLGFLSSLMLRSEGTFLFARTAEGIRQGEIDTLQQLHSSGAIPEHTVRVFSTIPFAPFLFIGVILTIFIQGSLLFI